MIFGYTSDYKIVHEPPCDPGWSLCTGLQEVASQVESINYPFAPIESIQSGGDYFFQLSM